MSDEHYLSLPRPAHRDRDHLAELLAGGVRTIPGMSHRLGAPFDRTRGHLTTMFTTGYFRVVDDDGTFHVHTALPGEELISVELYAAIITAVRRYGARTPRAIAHHVGLPLTPQLLVAIGVTLRIAINHDTSQRRAA